MYIIQTAKTHFENRTTLDEVCVCVCVDCEKKEKSVPLFYFVLLNTYQIPTSHTFD